MRKILGVALAILFALPLAAAAEEVTGKIKTIDRADQTFVLEDGTRLSIDEGQLADLKEGEKVQATFAAKGGKNVVVELDRRTVADGAETTNFASGTLPSVMADEVQTGDGDN